MARSSSAYLAKLQALLPSGAAWPRDPDSILSKFLAVSADTLARVDARADDLINEADPRTTYELLPDWERNLGLPDPCMGPILQLDARRAQVIARYTSEGGQSIPYFVAIAASLGFEITIEEYQLWNCESSCEDPMLDVAWAFAFTVHAPEVNVTHWTCEDSCETPLDSFGNEPLECLIRRYAPAHTTPIFAYGA